MTTPDHTPGLDDLIERVARAIHHAEAEPHKDGTGYGTNWDWPDVMPAVRERCLTAARAALVSANVDALVEALRDATRGLAAANVLIAALSDRRSIMVETFIERATAVLDAHTKEITHDR